MENTVDCKSEEGITVGLLDSLITVMRILRNRDLESECVQEALYDFVESEDLAFLLGLTGRGIA